MIVTPQLQVLTPPEYDYLSRYLANELRNPDLATIYRLKAKLETGITALNGLPALDRAKLHPGQIEIKDNARRFNVINCGRRFGKSILGEDLAIDPALDGYPVGWFSPDYKSLLEVWRDLCRILRPVTARKSEQEKRLELTTGGVIEFWSLDTDPECSRGRKYKRIIVDEAAKVRRLMHAWQQAILANLADFEGDAWFLSTPKGRNDFWELAERGKSVLHPDWFFIQRPTSANLSTNKDGSLVIKPAEIERMRVEMGPRISSQEVDAEFLEVGGRFFEEYETSEHGKESIHEVFSTSIKIERHWKASGGFDWGKAAPCAFGLLYTDDDGNIIITDEVYEAGLSNFEQATKIKRVLESRHLPMNTRIWADPSMFPPKDPAKRVGRYNVEDFLDAGLTGFAPANNDRINGWSRVKEYFRSRTIKKDDQGNTVSVRAGITIYKDRCPNLCRTIPLMEPLEKEPEDCRTDLEDHACDGILRYGIERPVASSLPASKQAPVYKSDLLSMGGGNAPAKF